MFAVIRRKHDTGEDKTVMEAFTEYTADTVHVFPTYTETVRVFEDLDSASKAFIEAAVEPEPIKREDLIQRLNGLAEWEDGEAAQDIAENLLLEYIDDKEIEEAFLSIPRW